VAAILTQGKFKIGRNESCPCGSGKKYKYCCGLTGGGRLGETLDKILEPRVAPGKPGRPEGAGNYEWTPAMDRALRELLARYDRGGTAPPGGRLAYAKRIDIGRRSPAFPVTPPGVRVRTGRFGGLSYRPPVNLGIPSKSK